MNFAHEAISLVVSAMMIEMANNAEYATLITDGVYFSGSYVLPMMRLCPCSRSLQQIAGP